MAKKAATKSQKNPDEEEIEEIEEEDDEQPEPEEAPDESPAPEEAPDEGAENKEGDGEPVNPPAGSHKITIKGEGTIPLVADGAMRRVERGKPIEVSDAELAVLDMGNVEYTKGKKK